MDCKGTYGVIIQTTSVGGFSCGGRSDEDRSVRDFSMSGTHILACTPNPKLLTELASSKLSLGLMATFTHLLTKSSSQKPST